MSKLRHLTRPLFKVSMALSEQHSAYSVGLIKSNLQNIVPPSYAYRTFASCKACTSLCAGRCLSSTTTPSSSRTINTQQADHNIISKHKTQEARPIHGLPSLTGHSSTNTASRMGSVASVVRAQKLSDKVQVTLSTGERFNYPTTWLRDNCQCSSCFNHVALGRSFLMEDLQLLPNPADVSSTEVGQLKVIWEDGHNSVYSADWLKMRAFTEEARQKYRNKYQLTKCEWSSDHQVARFQYSSLMEDDRALLEWLLVQEVWGATLLQDTPSDPAASYNLCERIAKVKYTHFGDYSHVVNHPKPNNLAYTNQQLNLHNDMPQYDEIPGLIFLHMVRQHSGPGGDTIISDGLHAAEQMRKRYPKEFNILTSTDIYFWDEGDAKDQMEMIQFKKINKGPTIELSNDGSVKIIRFNNQVRDSYLDLDEDDVNDFYAALKIYFNLLYANSISYKMKDGEMSVLDNVRCQHGRRAYTGQETGRHLVTTFMAWDEALCRRRRLQDKFSIAGS